LIEIKVNYKLVSKWIPNQDGNDKEQKNALALSIASNTKNIF